MKGILNISLKINAVPLMWCQDHIQVSIWPRELSSYRIKGKSSYCVTYFKYRGLILLSIDNSIAKISLYALSRSKLKFWMLYDFWISYFKVWKLDNFALCTGEILSFAFCYYFASKMSTISGHCIWVCERNNCFPIK